MSVSQTLAAYLDVAAAQDSAEAWGAFADCAADLWGERHRGSCALMLLSTIAEPARRAVIEAACRGAGYPVPALMDPRDDAELWASMATEAELRAYIFASLNRAPNQMRDGIEKFLRDNRAGRAA